MASRGGRTSGTRKGGARRNENNRIYGNPLPILFSPPENKLVSSALGLFGISGARVLNPHCEGVFDPTTRSVWVTNSKDSMILWQRGFFGKGNLSRKTASEEITAKRRAERKQFKLDRARAIAAAAAEAEAAFAEGRIISSEELKASIPSAATWKPSPSVKAEVTVPETPAQDEDEEEQPEPEPIEDLEHLQLTLPEAFFLAWALDCLTVLDPKTMEPMTLHDIWHAFQQAHRPPHLSLLSPTPQGLRADSPFLINYVFYHHYRSLGWVVKSGIKFCVDYLLYKRGPVFQHAEFAMVVIPIYEDPDDEKTSPYALQNVSPFSWQWLSTINRVNSQVQKTLILCYVTIPAASRVTPELLASPAAFTQYSIREHKSRPRGLSQSLILRESSSQRVIQYLVPPDFDWSNGIAFDMTASTQDRNAHGGQKAYPFSQTAFAFRPQLNVGGDFISQEAPLSAGSNILSDVSPTALDPSSSAPFAPPHTSTSSDSSDWALRRPRKEKARIALAPDQPPTTQGKPRTRVYVACAQCRGRKIRCDGARPVCHNCTQRADGDCNYDSAPKRRGPDKVQGARTRTTRAKDEEGRPIQKKRRKMGSTTVQEEVTSPAAAAPPPPTEATLGATFVNDVPIPLSPFEPKPVQYPYAQSAPNPPPRLRQPILEPSGSNVRFTSTSSYDQGLISSIAPDPAMIAADHSAGFSAAVPYPSLFAPAPVSTAYIAPADDDHDDENTVELGAEPSIQFSRKIWWDYLLFIYSSSRRPEYSNVPPLTNAQREYSMRNIVSDLRSLFKITNYWFSFFNVPRFYANFMDPVRRSRMQPSLVLAALAVGTYLQSSQLGRGEEGRRLALILRDEAQSSLDASLASRSVDEELAQAAWILAFFEICAHPHHHASRVFSSMAVCDAIIRSLALTKLDANDPQASSYCAQVTPMVASGPHTNALLYASERYGSEATSAPMPLDIPPAGPSVTTQPKQCSCETMSLGHNWPEAYEETPLWIATPAWNWGWSEGEVRKEECRRLVWSSMMLAAGLSSFTSASGLQTVDFFITHPCNYALLFPGDTLTPHAYPGAGLGKETVWALYIRSMLLWHSCLRVRQDETISATEKSDFTLRAWLETEEIEKALNRHTCGVERAFFFVGREYLFNTRMCISYEFQRFIPHV
ncbi:hypothetical protein EWM64_g3551 [Hericium alpestre]|uniref:tRNA-intron lyase n=1 Tax=Hericium alpestre TaxID=135208 RepID=A0A4Z0A3L5_9AGAM|nr:hypothetical protein EWM64_g3551 [Hericium alpestre]